MAWVESTSPRLESSRTFLVLRRMKRQPLWQQRAAAVVTVVDTADVVEIEAATEAVVAEIEAATEEADAVETVVDATEIADLARIEAPRRQLQSLEASRWSRRRFRIPSPRKKAETTRTSTRASDRDANQH